jgi:glycerol-3-phosphate O-acyltransferase/dihydroxyacetone phosphate acyltransferase
MLAYRALRGFLRLVVSCFFRNVEVVGLENIPQEGGVIFAGNHPNSLIDPVLVITQSNRPVHFAAKDVLFKSRFLRFFLTRLGAVPIRRRKDHKDKLGEGGKSLDNSAAFDALFEILADGKCMGIFPEGISHSKSQLTDFKTGAARIALGVREQYPDSTLSIVPVGLTYLHRHRVRSQVLLHFGEAIPVTDERVEDWKKEPKQASKELTERLEMALRGLTINAPDWEMMRVLHTARRLYKPNDVRLSLEEYAELTRRFAEGYLRAPEGHPVHQLKDELVEYQEGLDDLQLRDHDLLRELSMGEMFKRLLYRFGYVLFLLPLAIPGVVIHFPIIFSAVLAGDRLTAKKDVVATTKLVVSILTVPAMYLAMAGAVWLFASWQLSLFVLCWLPLTGYATLRVLEQHIALQKSLRSLTGLLRFRSRVEALCQMRIELEQKLHEMVDDLHDPTIPRMFEGKPSP